MRGQIKLYLAGCISYYYSNSQYKRATEWRNELAQKLLDCNADMCDRYFDWFDPCVNFEDNSKTANAKTVVYQNKYYLDKCDILIVNLEDLDKSQGTMYELFYYGIHNKPVIAFGHNKWENCPHIAESITVKLETIDDVVKYLSDYYCQ